MAPKAADHNHVKEIIHSIKKTWAINKPTRLLLPYRFVFNQRLTNVDGNSGHGDCLQSFDEGFLLSLLNFK